MKADNREGDCRIGALEVTLGFRYTQHLAGISESSETPICGIDFKVEKKNKSEKEQFTGQRKELKIDTRKTRELGALERTSSAGKFIDSEYSQKSGNNSGNTSMKYPEDLASSESTEWKNILLHSKLKSLW